MIDDFFSIPNGVPRIHEVNSITVPRKFGPLPDDFGEASRLSAKLLMSRDTTHKQNTLPPKPFDCVPGRAARTLSMIYLLVGRANNSARHCGLWKKLF